MEPIRLDKLHKLVKTARKNDGFEGTITVFDPGETTGIVQITKYSDHTLLRESLQVPGWPLEEFIPAVEQLFRGISKVIFESYHVYRWRLEEHTFSEVPTIQIIGAIKTLSIQQGIPYGEQTAQVGKGFWTDDRLQKFDLYFPGQKHARDALRHACQFLMFGLPSPKTKENTPQA